MSRAENHDWIDAAWRGSHAAALVLCSIRFALLLPALLFPGWAAAEENNSCENCHRDPDFLVTNKQLYEYFQEWSGSIHRQEGVTCDDCHGGDPRAPGKKQAHGEGVSSSDPSSGIHYKNVPDTCGTCHDEIWEGFRESNHFEHVEKKKGEEQ